jgi:hypothetical protein
MARALIVDLTFDAAARRTHCRAVFLFQRESDNASARNFAAGPRSGACDDALIPPVAQTSDQDALIDLCLELFRPLISSFARHDRRGLVCGMPNVHAGTNALAFVRAIPSRESRCFVDAFPSKAIIMECPDCKSSKEFSAGSESGLRNKKRQ